ncbi:MAG: TIGR03545 family protein [Spirochaetales bacterium]|nr:TIGR03545 family protein [Spirochaetales bacterium]
MAKKPPKAPKTVKLKKLPKPFNKKYSGDTFQKKVSKRIYLNEYKTFLQENLSKDSSGNLKLKNDLTKKDAKKFKKIAKTVRSNTGFVQKGKLMIIGILVLAIIGFNVFFKDMLAEWAAEAGLEAAFGARAEITGMQFQIFQGRVAFAHCSVANKDKPMHNLFELGKTEIKINTLDLAKGKVILENIECQEIQWNTARTFSGALPGAPAPVPEEQAAGESDPFAVLTGAGEVSGDIIKEQQDKLKSPALLDAAIADYPAINEKWDKKISDGDQMIKQADPKIKAATSINISQIKTIEQAQDAFAKIDAAKKEIDTINSELKTASKEFEKDAARVTSDSSAIQKAMNADYAFLNSFVTGSGSQSLSNVFIHKMAAKYLGDIYGYAMQALSYQEMLKPSGKEKVAEEPPHPEAGYFVRFPAVEKPGFWLQKADFSVGELSKDYKRGTLTDASSDPDLTGKPTVLAYKDKTGNQIIDVKGFIDGRKDAKNIVSASADASGFPFSISEGLDFLNIAKVDATATVHFTLTIGKAGGSSGVIGFDLTQLEIQKGNNSTYLADKAVSAILNTGRIQLSGKYSYDKDGNLSLSIDSNIESILSAAIDEAVGELTAEAKAKLKSEYDALLEGKLKAYKEYLGDFDNVTKGFDGNLADSKALDAAIEKKKKEVEAQIAKMTGGLGDKLKDTFKF